MKYKSVIVTRQGKPNVLQVVENELRLPAKNEICIKVETVPVCLPDVQARYGQTPFAPKTPFTPGYVVLGRINAVGSRVKNFPIGKRMAALTISGGYAEYIYLKPENLIPIPESINPIPAATLILNYLVAYQTLHRAARVNKGDTILIIGASGGVGTALMDLGQLSGLNMYGIASQEKHAVLEQYGVKPIDYKTEDFYEILEQAEPDGIDAVFDGMIYGYLDQGYSLLKKGGTWVQFGNPLHFSGLMGLLGRLISYNLFCNGRKLKLYGTTASKFGRKPYLEDWAVLFDLLKDEKISPVIHQTFPILEAAAANELLESGTVIGNIVLATPNLLSGERKNDNVSTKIID